MREVLEQHGEVHGRRQLDARLAVAGIERRDHDVFGSRERRRPWQRRAATAAQHIAPGVRRACPADPVRVSEREQQPDGVGLIHRRRHGLLPRVQSAELTLELLHHALDAPQ